MFSFFKRSDKEPMHAVARTPTPVRKSSRNAGLDMREPLPLPQVTEGNEDSDWAMWEDSVLEQDSQIMHGQFCDTVPSHFPPEAHSEINPDVDPFAKVDKHAP